MLTLEQVRAVNDGLSSGDLDAALRPLEETVDLRSNELPRVDKKALETLKSTLQEPENAQVWAQAALHPNISVRRFVRKTTLGLGEDAQPLAEPLEANLRRLWAEEEPLPWSNKAREAAARREQVEKVESALEMLLRADPDRFVALQVSLAESAAPVKQQATEKLAQWQEKHKAYSNVWQEARNRVIKEDWGEEFLDNYSWNKLPSRAWREINEKVENDPQVARLRAEMGENPWSVEATSGWQPQTLFSSALSSYVDPKASGPKQKIAARVRPHLWNWIETALDDTRPRAERDAAVNRLHGLAAGWQLLQWLGPDELRARLPQLLQQARLGLLDQLKSLRQHDYYGISSIHSLWLQLAGFLGQACIKPYNVKDSEWSVPAHITPELLRGLKTGAKDLWVNNQLESAAASLEKLREREKTEAAAPPQAEVSPVEAIETAEVSFAALPPVQIAFSYEEMQKLHQEAQASGQPYAEVMARKQDEARREIEAIDNVEERVEKLIRPIIQNGKQVLRLPYWNVWERKLGREVLLKTLWPLAGPRLWALYEETLADYRRVEAEEPSDKLKSKLTERETKQLQTESRREARQKIQNELSDIANVLRAAEGMEANIKILRLLEKPGFKELLKNQQYVLLNELGQTQHLDDGLGYKRSTDPIWLRENWFLSSNDAPLVAELEEKLLGNSKLSDWERDNARRLLAVAHYRLNTPESRARFRELISEIDQWHYGLSIPICALGDAESWLLLASRAQWGDSHLEFFWKQVRERGDDDTRRLLAEVVREIAASSNERGAKFLLGFLKEVPASELEPHAVVVLSALESPLVPVKRWALATLPKLNAGWNAETAAQSASEMLWSENGALVKEAIKFLGTMSGDATPIAWDALQEATSLENVPTLEVVFRALVKLQKANKNVDLTFSDAAKSRLEELSELVPDRFGSFAAKF